MLIREATITSFIVFGFDLTGARTHYLMYRTQDEHVNHYTTDVVVFLVIVW